MESDATRPPALLRPDTHAAETLLRDVFGFDAFLPFQREIIETILKREELLAVLPTGSGKSLCFQIPALLREGLTVVISPLIALMKDQIDTLRSLALPVECLHSSLSRSESERVLDDLRGSRLKMIYISPERLRDGFFLDAVAAGAQTPLLWVVDEAHCITEWGHDFRTDYLYIPDAVGRLSEDAQMVMFTATATPAVRADILRQMRRESARTLCASFDRPNLYLGCRRAPAKTDKFRAITELLRRPGPGIIYTATRRQCEDVNRFLQEQGKNSDYYHAGRPPATRGEVHERFMSNDIDIIAATNAFGMGVDKPDIRFIIHYAHPSSIDSYYQEIGRGGRDGGRCDCILLFSRYDRKVQEQFIFNATPTADLVEECFREIVSSGGGSGEISLSRQTYENRNIELFEMEKAGVLNRRPVMCGSASIYLLGELDSALDRCAPLQKRILTALDGLYGLAARGYADDVDVRELRRERFPESDTFELEQALLQMSGGGIIMYRSNERTICYSLRTDAVSEETRSRIEESVAARRAFKMKRLDTMAQYASVGACLREFLLGALDDAEGAGACGFCDNCI
jgi:ATP-dependent DNA helicase RecQ